MNAQQTISKKKITAAPVSTAGAVQQRLLIIGGGAAALGQLQLVLAAGIQTGITLVSRELLPEIKELAGNYGLRLLERAYTVADLEDTDLIIIATDDPAQSGHIHSDIHRAGIGVTIAVKPEHHHRYANVLVKEPNRNTILPDIFTGQQQPSLYPLASGTAGKGPAKEFSYAKIASRALLIFAVMLIGHFLFSYLPYATIREGAVQLYRSFDQTFLIMLLAGFVAQLVDGALGMGYGVTSATILLSAGVNPAAISGSIHTAEMFASGASGYSHYRFGNVNKKLFRTLLIPGVVGAILGAVLLVYLGEKYSTFIRPLLACYTLFLGIKILSNAFRNQIRKKKYKHYRALAGAGGFFDSFGGGGWGPIVTTTLITKGRSPKYVIGSVSLTEFFVTLSSAFTFFIFLGVSHWQTILGLIIGGLIAAPVAAKLAGKLPRKTAFILLGILVVIWSVKILAGVFR
ncbi:TSUP family transporter [Niabella pedocola]|uniref:Probable membrane transporter protein n=1 Tax=Niabella pedocola TaxID=1752077 RepID=A0ABS8PXF9_9BACT|nr:TSUP family transporter [Niabella pedocola]MCD2425033.1 TSUP family transporter [Niabella pedocola]